MPEDPDKITEEEAIAKVIMMEDEYHRESQSTFLWTVKRIAAGAICVGILILVALFPFIVMNKAGEYPIKLIVFSAFLIAGGIAGVLWVYMQENAKKKDPFDF